MQIFVFLAPGFEEIEAIAPVDVFRRAGLQVTTVSIDSDLEVSGAHNVSVKADKLFSDIDWKGDFLLYLPGGMPGTTNLEQHSGLQALLARQAENKGRIAAICAAPSILGKMGLLKKKEAICYPGFENFLLEATLSQSSIAIADNILTAKGPGVSIPFALRIVEELKGKKTAEEVAEAMIF